MRVMGWLLLMLGGVLLLVGLFMDTSVETGRADALTGMLARVHNMGLMSQRQLLLDLGQHGTLLGVLLLVSATVVDHVQAAAALAERRSLEVIEHLKKLERRD